MLRRIAQAAAVVVASLMVVPDVKAATYGDFTSFSILGDSLSDPGNVHSLTFGLVPRRPYWRGRFSNGRVWSDYLARDFADAGVRTYNYAHGGAEATGYRNLVPDLYAQRRMLRLSDRAQDRLGERPLVAIWAGANDKFGAIGNGGAQRAARRAADAVAETAGWLSRRGVNDVMILNMPNLGEIPRYFGTELQTTATRATRAYNERLNQRVGRLESNGLNVIFVDIAAEFDRLLEDPAAYGFKEVRTPCYRNRRVCSRPDEYFFWDTMHPTTAAHARIADEVRAALTGSPLLMATGVGGEIEAMAASVLPIDGPLTVAAQASGVAPVPLPAPALLLVAALGGLGLLGRFRARPAAA